MKPTQTFCLSLLAMVSAAPATAMSIAEGRISSLSILVEDLNTVDSAAASVTFSNSYVVGRVLSNGGSAPDEFKTSVYQTKGNLSPLHTEAPVPTGFAASAIAQFQGSPTGTLSASSYSNVERGVSEALMDVSTEFHIAPYSRLSVGGTLYTYAASVGLPEGGLGQFGQVMALALINAPGYSDVVSALASATPLQPNGSFYEAIDSRSFLWSISNYSDAWLTGALFLEVNANVQNSAVAVPEPTSTALLLVGLGVLGWRHKQARGRRLDQAERTPSPN